MNALTNLNFLLLVYSFIDRLSAFDQPKTNHPLLQTLTKYEVVALHQFEDYHHYIRKNELTTKSHQIPGLHISDAHFSVEYEGKTYNLDLQRNNDLLPASFMTSTYTQTGDLLMHKPTLEELNHCYYHGRVRDIEGSQVIASTCQGLRGCIILPDDDLLVIEPLNPNTTKKHDHVVYRTRHVKQPVTGSCGNEDGPSHVESFLNQLKLYSNAHSKNMTLHRREKRQATTERKFVELLMVADSLEANKYPNRVDLENRIKELANYLDGFYQKLGIRIVLSHIEVWSNRDRATLSADAQQTLNSFTEYRKQRMRTEPSSSAWRYADNVHLLYGGDFVGSTIGMASIGTMCSSQSVGVNQDHSSNVINTAATVAHEMGHNFGMLHDSPGCSCPESSSCIMAASSGHSTSLDWSSCSKDYLDQNLKMGLKSCLLNVPEPSRIYGGPRCGNEIVEEGEECDCGEPGFCPSSCCDPRTCRLLPGAECDAGLCCSSCRLLAAGTLCRGTENNECELPEFCTGSSAYCPADYYKEDGTPCLQQTATCYEGVCLTHTMQCQNTWGPGATNGDDLCYVHVNAAGTNNGNCGRNDQGQFIKCSERNAKCGKLQCSGGSSRPIIGSGRIVFTNQISNGLKSVRCRTVGSDPSNSDILDPGLVRSGTRCAEGKVCLEGICQDVPVLTCSARCNGHGVCNNLGNCHCDSGWAPPFCAQQGNGGSIDSGSETIVPTISPTSRPTTTKQTTVRPTTIKRPATRRPTIRRPTTRRPTTRRPTIRRPTTRRPTTRRPTTRRPTTRRPTIRRPTIRSTTTKRPFTTTTSPSTLHATPTGLNTSDKVPGQTPVGIIVAIIVLVLVVLVAAALFAYCYYFRRRPLKRPKWLSNSDTRANVKPRTGRNVNGMVQPKSMSRENLISTASPVAHHKLANDSDHYLPDSTIPSNDIRRAAPPPPVSNQSHSTPPQVPKSKPPAKPTAPPPANPTSGFDGFKKPSAPVTPYPNSSNPPKPVVPFTKPTSSISPLSKQTPSSFAPPSKPKPTFVPPVKPTLSPSVPSSKPTSPPARPLAKPATAPVVPLNKPTLPQAKPTTPPISSTPRSPPNLFTKPKPAVAAGKPQLKPIVPGDKPRTFQNQISKPSANKPPQPPSKPKTPKPLDESDGAMSVRERARMLNAV